MVPHALSLCSLLLAATSVYGQSSTETASAATVSVTPLVDRRYAYGQQPYQVDPTDPPSADGSPGRGPQQGYNICNSTTQTQTSMCQTSMVNSLDDFCLWGPPIVNETIGDTEGESVAWCSKPGHGTRVMPAGTITAAQFLKAPAYLQVTGLLNQVNIDMQSDDGGGELDPHGADFRGNPLGGLIYSNGFPSNGGNNNSYQQVIEWHNFMGSDVFCIKICDPAVANSKQYCQNIFDRIGCQYNAPASYAPNEFSVCDSDNQDPPGIYTDASGAVQTYTQPAESLGPISTMPYTAKIPQTSNCVTYQSSALYAAAASITASSQPSSSASGIASASSASVTGKSASTSASGSAHASSVSTKASVSASTKASASASGSTSTASANSAAGLTLSGASGVAGLIATFISIMVGLGAVVVVL